MIYERKSRMPAKVQQRLLEYFVGGTTARAAAGLTGVQIRTAIIFYQRLRQLIASKQESYELSGEVEADESYFGGVRKGKRGRGAGGKVPVFGLLKRGGKVYTAIIPNAKASTLIPIIREKVTPDSIVYTDSFQVYDVLDVSEFQHRRVNHSKTFVSKRGHHINPHFREDRLHRELLEPGQASFTPLQRYTKGQFLWLLEGMRVAFQRRQP